MPSAFFSAAGQIGRDADRACQPAPPTAGCRAAEKPRGPPNQPPSTTTLLRRRVSPVAYLRAARRHISTVSPPVDNPHMSRAVEHESLAAFRKPAPRFQRSSSSTSLARKNLTLGPLCGPFPRNSRTRPQLDALGAYGRAAYNTAPRDLVVGKTALHRGLPLDRATPNPGVRRSRNQAATARPRRPPRMVYAITPAGKRLQRPRKSHAGARGGLMHAMPETANRTRGVSVRYDVLPGLRRIRHTTQARRRPSRELMEKTTGVGSPHPRFRLLQRGRRARGRSGFKSYRLHPCLAPRGREGRRVTSASRSTRRATTITGAG
jgi:hypothetical protein